MLTAEFINACTQYISILFVKHPDPLDSNIIFVPLYRTEIGPDEIEDHENF